jgi:hypothetical protein
VLPERRERLLADCYRIYREHLQTLTRQDFAEAFFGHPATRIGLFHGEDGRLAGFCNLAVISLDLDGRRHEVLIGGVHILLDYRGGDAAGLFVLREAFRHKLRTPLRPFVYLALAATPASYHLLASLVPRLSPASGCHPAPELDRKVRAIMRVRGLQRIPGVELVDDDPWLLRTRTKLRDPERMRRSRRLQGEPEVKFYQTRNPGWQDAEGATALLVWIPGTFRNMVGVLWRMLVRRSRL